jgi:hypothetical protein
MPTIGNDTPAAGRRDVRLTSGIDLLSRRVDADFRFMFHAFARAARGYRHWLLSFLPPSRFVHGVKPYLEYVFALDERSGYRQ